MKFLLRRWRSVAFRSGLAASFIVGVITAVAIVAFLFLIFTTLVLSGSDAQLSLMNFAQNQLGGGADPADLELPDLLLVSGEDSFWLVLEDGEIVRSEGEVNQEVVDAPFTEDGFIEVNMEDGPGSSASEPSADGSDEPGAFGQLQDGLKRVDGSDWLYLEGEVTAPDETVYTVVSATQGPYSLGGLFADSFLVTFSGWLIITGASGLATGYFTRRGLKSVERMRAEVEQISQQSLNRRVPETGARDRIDKLAITMNDMLGRLETSSKQQNQFLADASHELRSPVAGLLAQLDVAATYPDRADAATLLPKLRNEAQRLQALIDDLLFLSRSEAGEHRSARSGPGAVSPVQGTDVTSVLVDEVERQQTLAPQVEIITDFTPGLAVWAPSTDLTRAMRNLVDNAVRHATSTVHIRAIPVGVGPEGTIVAPDSSAFPMVAITIGDDGSGIDPDQAERVFDRFVRLDDGRSRDVGGSGLGLAIVRELVTRNEGRVRLVQGALAPGATFEVVLPAAPLTVLPSETDFESSASDPPPLFQNT